LFSKSNPARSFCWYLLVGVQETTEAKTKGWSVHGPCGGTTDNDIIRWWESRRLHSNLYVGLTGFATWRLVLVVGGASVKPGKNFEETPSDDFRPNRLGDPSLPWATGSAGSLTSSPSETIREKRFSRPDLSSASFSQFLPGLRVVTAYLITIHTGQKLDCDARSFLANCP
jgi:hypothetical protein